MIDIPFAKAIAALIVAGVGYLVLKSGVSLPVGWEATIEGIVVAVLVFLIPNTPSANRGV